MSLNVTSNIGVIGNTNYATDKAFNLSQPENASTTEFEDKVILDSIVHHDSPMYLLINRKATDNNFYIHSPILGDITLTGSDRKIYPVDSNMNRNCIGGKLHPLGNGYVAYSVYSNNMDATSKFRDSDTGSLELITGVIKANPYLGYYKSVNGINFYGIENDEDGFMQPYKELDGKFVAVAWSSNYFAYSTDGINWTESTISSTSRSWQSVCYGNGKFVAVASSTNYFAYSTDGMNWTEGTISNTSREWRSVCYGNDKFVAVAWFSNYFAYSTDGINWIESTISNTNRYWNSVCYGSYPSIEFSNNHTGISSDVTDVNGISSMTTYTEQYTEDVYYIHYAWVDRASSSLVRYNILTRKIDTSSGIPVISNVASYTTTFSIGTIAHPSFHKDKNGIHCAFYHGNTTYTKYYKLTRSGTDDSTWSWGVDSNTYITNENISLMVNKNENNLQSSLAQSARRMYMVNSSDNLVEFKKTQTF